jgi:hypothetical protein
MASACSAAESYCVAEGMTMNDKEINAAGGPAFPVSLPGCGDTGWHGMSLRDWFAGQAMQQCLKINENFLVEAISNDKVQTAFDGLATISYWIADAMLKERDMETGSK